MAVDATVQLFKKNKQKTAWILKKNLAKQIFCNILACKNKLFFVKTT